MPYVGPPITGRYMDLLAWIHDNRRPRTYVEIGMKGGGSLALARPETIVVGIDPSPEIWSKVNADARLFFETSDDFFATQNVSQVLSGNPIDLAFIDGMHLFEYALRDFSNVESNATTDSVVLVHDCLPGDAAMASRTQGAGMWTGDTWKLVCCLTEMRPDLDVSVVAVGSTGLGVIRNLDPSSTVLRDRYDEALARFGPLDFDHVDGRQQEILRLVPNEPEVVEGLMPAWPPLAGRDGLAPKRYPRSFRVIRHHFTYVTKRTIRRAQNAVLGRVRKAAPS